MNRKLMTVALLSMTLLTSGWAKSTLISSRDLVVIEPSALPELARSQSQAMMLYPLGNGQIYLYLEQQQLARLVILNVTNPAHIEVVGSMKLDAPVSFDFVQPIADSVIVICFRDNHGSGILDLHKPRTPLLIASTLFKKTMPVEVFGESASAMIDWPTFDHAETARDYQVIDTADPRSPHLLTTIRLVQQRIEESNTGTVFFLGADGLTVIRHPYQEALHRALDPGGRS